MVLPTPKNPAKAHEAEKSRYDKALDNQRHTIENMFARLKDWRSLATRYDRWAHTFFSSICIFTTLALCAARAD
ncbi:MAG: transposase [Gammaproteobacteria bacterium]